MSLIATSRRETFTGMLLVSLLSPLGVRAQSPPPDLASRVALRATQTRRARDQFTYRQTVVIEELSPSGARAGQYREIRDIVFSPLAERSDIREVQPFLFDSDQLWFYETRFKGEETIDGVDCYLLQVRPRQILAGQRLFDGLVWAAKKDYSIVRTEGQAVPEIRSLKNENLFPRFTTLWGPVDGDFRFPLYTYADDTLDFRVGPLRIRLSIRYSNYQRFAAESTVKFGEPAAPSAPSREQTP
jgi:hypothetical protein